jgi:Flp pilus assembly protein TadD
MKRGKKAEPPPNTPAAPPPEKRTRGGRGNFSQTRGEQTAAAPAAPGFWFGIAAAGVMVLCAVAAYHNSFGGAFVYDDETAIINNPTIRQLWPLAKVLSPPCDGETVGGRPLLNLSLAINYAISGLDTWSYHAANLAIHIAAAWLLFGILRRTFLSPLLHDRFGGAALPLALAVALLWMVHPLQTESVTYIVQRAESLSGLFYLLTLYCVIRGAGCKGTVPIFARAKMGLSPWYAAAVLACLLGMACKEVLVTAPLTVLLYDGTFLAGSFAAAWRQRWRLYLGLAATWGLLAGLVFSTGLIGRQVEFGVPDAWSYARSQPGVILHYLRLCVWPKPLCLDYAWPVANTLGEILPGAMVVGLLVGATLWGLVGRKAYGFLGAWFFLILAPTSSILPLRQLAFEHRMYLSLAAVAALVTAGGYALWDRLLSIRAGQRGQSPFSPGLWTAKKGTVPRLVTMLRWAAPVALLAAVLLALGCATAARNSDYQSLLAIWQDTVDKRPGSSLAQYNLGNALGQTGRTAEAIEHYHQALRLRPDHAQAHNNLANALARSGRMGEAIEQYHETLRLKPDHVGAHNGLGTALAATGKWDQAIPHYQEALRLKPDNPEAHNNLANVLAGLGKTPEALEHYQQALQLKPDYAEAHNNLGYLLAGLGRTEEAMEHYRQALRLKPNYTQAHNNLAHALADIGKIDEAIEHYRQVLLSAPNHVGAALDLAWLLATHDPAQGGDPALAVPLAQRARELSGQENVRCLDTLAAAYAAAGRFDDAVITAERALRLAEAAGEAPLSKAIRARLELYRAGRPYREKPPPPEHLFKGFKSF